MRTPVSSATGAPATVRSYSALKDSRVEVAHDRASCDPSEDAYLLDLRNMLFGVADGFGGQGAGDIASKKVLEDVKYFVGNGLGDSEVTLPFVYRSYLTATENLLFNALLYANANLNESNKDKHANHRAGVSLAVGIFHGKHLSVASVGSCCVVLVRGGVVMAVNRPRTLHTMMTCEIFKQDAEKSYDRASCDQSMVPLLALGMAKDIEPEMAELKVVAGDRILFCTDGLYPFVGEADFANLVENQALIDSARGFGSKDDIAVLNLLI